MARIATAILCCSTLVAAEVEQSQTDLQLAAAEVQRETRGKILSATRIESRNRAFFRIKVLTEDGRVRVVEVPEGRVAEVRRQAEAEARETPEAAEDEPRKE